LRPDCRLWQVEGRPRWATRKASITRTHPTQRMLQYRRDRCPKKFTSDKSDVARPVDSSVLDCTCFAHARSVAASDRPTRRSCRWRQVKTEGLPYHDKRLLSRAEQTVLAERLISVRIIIPSMWTNPRWLPRRSTLEVTNLRSASDWPVRGLPTQKQYGVTEARLMPPSLLTTVGHASGGVKSAREECPADGGLEFRRQPCQARLVCPDDDRSADSQLSSSDRSITVKGRLVAGPGPMAR
jgi:hypothetical protein